MSPGQMSSPNEWVRSRAFAIVAAAVYVGCAIWLMYELLGKPVAGMDDANIFFVYARNVVHGHGIVYSVGGEHVEGFTSVLYFLLCSACYAVTSSPETLLLIGNALFAVTATALMLRVLVVVSEAAGLSRWAPVLLMAGLLAWICCNPAYFAWNVVSLMDSGLYGLMIVWAYAVLAKMALGSPVWQERWQVGAVAVALILVRPEGLAWAVLLLVAYPLLRLVQGERTIALLRRVWPPYAAAATTVLGLLVFRLVYFGQPLPNTYYAKVSSSLASTLADGWQYFTSFVAMYGIAVWLAMAGIVILLAFALRRGLAAMDALQRVAVVTACFAMAGLVLPVLEGGDHFYAFRMFQPVWPLLGACVLLPAVVVPTLRPRPRVALYVASCAMAIAVGDSVTWTRFAASNSATEPIAEIRLDVLAEFSIAQQERLNGERLSEIFAPDLPTVGFGSAGGIAYGYQGRVYDMMGLNDTLMAHADRVKTGPKGHQSFNKAVFYQISPDVLMPRAVPMADPVSLAAVSGYYMNPAGWDNLIFKGLYNDPEFRAKYMLALVWNSLHPQYKCYGYFNRTYLFRALQQGHVKLLDLAR